MQMAEQYDVVVAGAGHNGLIAACYAAKAGLKDCVVEQDSDVGGGTKSRELVAPGCINDMCSVSHSRIQARPVIRDDELQLISKCGLEYRHPEKITAMIFDNGDVLEFYTDMERTCQSIAKISPRDGDNYRRFCNEVFQTLD